MYMYNDDPGTMNSSSGYLIAPDDDEISDPNGFYQAFIDLAWDIAGDTPTVGDALLDDNTLGYTYTPYGIHLICVSMTPFAEGYQSVDYNTLSMEEVITLLKTNLINLSGDTLYETIKETIRSEKETALYTDYNNATVPADVDEDTSIVTIETKKVESLKADYAAS